MTLGTRAVIRLVEPGDQTECRRCGVRITWAARQRRKQVIANVYEGPRWDRVEHFHTSCYEEAGEPHGKPHG